MLLLRVSKISVQNSQKAEYIRKGIKKADFFETNLDKTEELVRVIYQKQPVFNGKIYYPAVSSAQIYHKNYEKQSLILINNSKYIERHKKSRTLLLSIGKNINKRGLIQGSTQLKQYNSCQYIKKIQEEKFLKTRQKKISLQNLKVKFSSKMERSRVLQSFKQQKQNKSNLRQLYLFKKQTQKNYSSKSICSSKSRKGLEVSAKSRNKINENCGNIPNNQNIALQQAKPVQKNNSKFVTFASKRTIKIVPWRNKNDASLVERMYRKGVLKNKSFKTIKTMGDYRSDDIN